MSFLFIKPSTGQDFEKIRNAFEESYSLEKEGEYSKAIEIMKTVYDEESYEINLRLGWLHYNSGFFSESSSYYRRAISLMPYSIEAKFGLALPVYAQGQVEEVIKLYEDVLKIDPKNYTANYRLGSIYYGKENYTLGLHVL